MTNWQPIKTAPKDGLPISVKEGDGIETVVQWRDHDKMPSGPGWIDNYGRYRNPIKWNQDYDQRNRI